MTGVLPSRRKDADYVLAILDLEYFVLGLDDAVEIAALHIGTFTHILNSALLVREAPTAFIPRHYAVLSSL